MIEIMLDGLVNEDLPAVRNLITQGCNDADDAAAPTRKPERKGRAGQVGLNLYNAIINLFCDNTRMNEDQVRLVSAYETALGIFRSAALELRRHMDVITLEARLNATKEYVAERGQDTAIDDTALAREITDAKFFSNRYALFIAGNIGLDLIGRERVRVKNIVDLGTNYDVSDDRDRWTRRLAGQACEDLGEICRTDKTDGHEREGLLLQTLQLIFSSWANQFDYRSFENVAKARGIAEHQIKFSVYSVSKGIYSRKNMCLDIQEDRIMKVSRAEIIDPGELCDKIWLNMLMLTAYDSHLERNPYSPASVVFTYGDPGCGKTIKAHACMRDLAELCRQKGIALMMFTHNVTDYASHFQNQTAVGLAQIADRINAFPGSVVVYIADADVIFQSRSDAHMTQEQKQTQGVYFSMFDGSRIKRNGKVLWLMDANYVDGIDPATRDRVFDDIVEAKRFSTAEHFSQYARMSLCKDSGDAIRLTDDDWSGVGKYLLGSGLTHRSIGYVFKQILRGVSMPEAMVGARNEEHIAYIQQGLGKITKESVMSAFNAYVQRVHEIDEATRKKKFDEKVLRYLADLNIAREMKSIPAEPLI